jgi:hypothetical protein
MRGMETTEMSFLRSSSGQTVNSIRVVLLEKEEDNRKYVTEYFKIILGHDA